MVERIILETDHFWTEDELTQTWIAALEAIDYRGDKEPLIQLLKNTEINATAAWHLADLLDRYNLTKLRGGQRTPSYDYPPALRKLIQAQKYYKRYVARRMSKDRAFEQAASTCGVKEEKLRNLVSGKYASARRVQKRKPRPKPLP
jgi:hypothetical protein